MKLDLSRVIIFTDNMTEMEDFYGRAIGLKVVGREDGWVELSGGTCNIALHSGRAKPGNRSPKLVFYADDVAAARAYLIKRASDFGPVKSTGTFDMCDGKDPDGNPVQISGRK
ncbi:VOC family protein [Sphingomonas bacterium]|uniref:VOC family protein n=1 Tax=Sphingomonas bacterium TaxID=1895847 RepID=UPI0015769B9E|nr:VOC family protein [Sphingomonas bacterium]